jgi:RNA polymerase sigma factor (sigma-70 family)
MAIKSLGAAVGDLNRLFVEGTVSGLADDQLLDRFLATRDGAAFEALMARHGPMVLRVCRAVVRNPSDAEDAFQATFLVMVKKARTLRCRANVGGWLYMVAYRVAIQANAAAARRRVQERRAGEMSALTSSHDPIVSDDLVPVLHEEIARLPERFRLAVVLCDLQGLTQAEAAESLQWSTRTLQRRLAEGRERLKLRLGRRGLECSGAVLAALRLRNAGTLIPPAWQESTLRAALDLLNSTVAAGTVSAAAHSQTHEVLKKMFVQKLVVASAALMGACLTIWALSAAWITHGDQPPKAATTPLPQRVGSASPPLTKCGRKAPAFRRGDIRPPFLSPLAC